MDALISKHYILVVFTNSNGIVTEHYTSGNKLLENGIGVLYLDSFYTLIKDQFILYYLC